MLTGENTEKEPEKSDELGRVSAILYWLPVSLLSGVCVGFILVLKLDFVPDWLAYGLALSLCIGVLLWGAFTSSGRKFGYFLLDIATALSPF